MAGRPGHPVRRRACRCCPIRARLGLRGLHPPLRLRLVCLVAQLNLPFAVHEDGRVLVRRRRQNQELWGDLPGRHLKGARFQPNVWVSLVVTLCLSPRILSTLLQV